MCTLNNLNWTLLQVKMGTCVEFVNILEKIIKSCKIENQITQMYEFSCKDLTICLNLQEFSLVKLLQFLHNKNKNL